MPLGRELEGAPLTCCKVLSRSGREGGANVFSATEIILNIDIIHYFSVHICIISLLNFC